jgi:hypothetical protein
MSPLVFGAYGCDPFLGPGSIAGGHPVVQTLSKAHTDTEQICTEELEVQTLSQSNTDSNIISTYKLKRFAHY